MTVGELIAELQAYDRDADVMFVCDYGDYHHTQQALDIEQTEMVYRREIAPSAYSLSGYALIESEDEPRSYCESCDLEFDGIATCPKCGNATVGEDGERLDDDDDCNEVVLLRY